MNNIFHSKIFTVLSFVFIVFLGFLIVKNRPLVKSLDGNISSLEEKISEAELKTEELESDFSFFESDTYLERQARLKLNLKKPNEFIAYIIREEKISTASDEKIEERGLIQKTFDFISDLFKSE